MTASSARRPVAASSDGRRPTSRSLPATPSGSQRNGPRSSSYAADNDQRVRCFMSLADGVLALLGGDDNTAERHWHDLLAVSSEHGFGLLWIDALEGLAICAARAGATDEAARLVGAAESARQDRGLPVPLPAPRRAAVRFRRRAGHSRWRKRRRTHVGRAGERVRPVVGLGGADTNRSRGRPSGRRRADQQAGRRASVHERANGEDPPPAHLRQARDRQPLPTRHRGGAEHNGDGHVIPHRRTSSRPLPTSSLARWDRSRHVARSHPDGRCSHSPDRTRLVA